MTSGISSPTSVPTSSTMPYSRNRNAPGAYALPEQRGRQRAADQRHQQFDAQKVRGQLPLEIARQPRSQAHGKQIGADDGGELQHRIAQHIRRQHPGGQFVQQAAGRHHEKRWPAGRRLSDAAQSREPALWARWGVHARALSSCCASPSKVSQPNTAFPPLLRAHSSPTWRFSSS